MTHSPQAEQNVIGAILQEPKLYDDVAEILTWKDFYDLRHAKYFDLMGKMQADGVAIDPLDLADRCGDTSEDDFIYITDLLVNVPSSANATAYARLVSEKAGIREAKGQVIEIQKIAASDCNLDSMLSQIKNIADNMGREKPTSLSTKELLAECIKDVEARSRNEIKAQHIKIGLTEVDKRLFSISETDYIVISGRPGSGKTAAMLQVIRATLEYKPSDRVLVFSLEMTGKALILRMLSALADISNMKMREGSLTGKDWAALSVAAETVSGWGDRLEIIEDTGDEGMHYAQISAKIRRTARQGDRDLALACVDYAQLIAGEPKHTDRERVSRASRCLSRTAKKTKVPVLALAQVNRDPDKRPDKRPLASDTSDSDQIERDAAIFIVLYNDEKLNPNSTQKGVIEWISRKLREGEIGTDYIKNELWKSKFANLQQDLINDEEYDSYEQAGDSE